MESNFSQPNEMFQRESEKIAQKWVDFESWKSSKKAKKGFCHIWTSMSFEKSFSKYFQTLVSDSSFLFSKSSMDLFHYLFFLLKWQFDLNCFSQATVDYINVSFRYSAILQNLFCGLLIKLGHFNQLIIWSILFGVKITMICFGNVKNYSKF